MPPRRTVTPASATIANSGQGRSKDFSRRAQQPTTKTAALDPPPCAPKHADHHPCRASSAPPGRAHRRSTEPNSKRDIGVLAADHRPHRQPRSTPRPPFRSPSKAASATPGPGPSAEAHPAEEPSPCPPETNSNGGRSPPSHRISRDRRRAARATASPGAAADHELADPGASHRSRRATAPPGNAGQAAPPHTPETTPAPELRQHASRAAAAAPSTRRGGGGPAAAVRGGLRPAPSSGRGGGGDRRWRWWRRRISGIRPPPPGRRRGGGGAYLVQLQIGQQIPLPSSLSISLKVSAT